MRHKVKVTTMVLGGAVQWAKGFLAPAPAQLLVQQRQAVVAAGQSASGALRHWFCKTFSMFHSPPGSPRVSVSRPHTSAEETKLVAYVLDSNVARTVAQNHAGRNTYSQVAGTHFVKFYFETEHMPSVLSILGLRGHVIDITGRRLRADVCLESDTTDCIVKTLYPKHQDSTLREIRASLMVLRCASGNAQMLALLETKRKFHMVWKYKGPTVTSSMVDFSQNGVMRQFVRDLARAFCNLREHGLVHNDVSLRNIVKERDSGKFSLIDYGRVIFLSSGERTTVGSYRGSKTHTIDSSTPILELLALYFTWLYECSGFTDEQRNLLVQEVATQLHITIPIA